MQHISVESCVCCRLMALLVGMGLLLLVGHRLWRWYRPGRPGNPPTGPPDMSHAPRIQPPPPYPTIMHCAVNAPRV